MGGDEAVDSEVAEFEVVEGGAEGEVALGVGGGVGVGEEAAGVVVVLDVGAVGDEGDRDLLEVGLRLRRLEPLEQRVRVRDPAREDEVRVDDAAREVVLS